MQNFEVVPDTIDASTDRHVGYRMEVHETCPAATSSRDVARGFHVACSSAARHVGIIWLPDRSVPWTPWASLRSSRSRGGCRA